MKEYMQFAIEDALKNVFTNVGKHILGGVINSSYYLCLFVSLAALLLYISGDKKAGKYVSISFLIYFFLQSIKDVVM